MPLDGKYIGKGNKIKLLGVQVGVADSEWSFKRGTGKAARSGMESDLKWPGKLDGSFKLTNNYFKGLYLGMLLGSTVNTGPSSDVQLDASIAAPSTTPALFTPSVTAAQMGVAKFQALANITSPGTAYIAGVNFAGGQDFEIITIPTCSSGALIYGQKPWQSILYGIATGWAGGALELFSTAKVSSVSVGRPPYFSVEGTITSEDGTETVDINADSCFFTDTSLKGADTDKLIDQPLSGEISDCDPPHLLVTYTQ